MKLLVIVLLSSLVLACSPKKLLDKLYSEHKEIVAPSGKLTDEKVTRYAKTVRRLHDVGKNLPQNISEGKELDPNLYSKIDKIVKEEGFTDYFDFIQINAKVAWAFSVSEGETSMKDFEDVKDQSLKQMEEILQKPEVPEDSKQEIRKAIEQINTDWNKNKKYANLSLELVKPLTDPDEIEIIKKHRKELLEAFTGMKADDLDWKKNYNILKSDFGKPTN